MKKLCFLTTILISLFAASCGRLPALAFRTADDVPAAAPVGEVGLAQGPAEPTNAEAWGEFEAELELLRQEMRIPGMSAAVVKDGELVWARGFGYADVENRVPATPETPYHLASVTKTFAAVIMMQLVQEGKLSLDDPVSRYGVTLPEGDSVLVRHLMSHTSAGTPGTRFQYDGARYGLLSQIIQAATGRSLQEWLFERILQPLGMENTAPSPPAACAGLSFAPACERVHAALTQLYIPEDDSSPAPGFNGDYFNAGAGLMSTVVDLAKYDASLDANTLVTETTKELMWTPAVSNSGQRLPYGLGWFTQVYRGTRLIWHSGFSPPSTSSLFLKLPEEGLTFIVLANTDLVSRHFQAGNGDAADVLRSLPALTFYKHFVLAPQNGQPTPAIDWTGDNKTVLEAINGVEDKAVREVLTRELLSRRGVATSLEDLSQWVRSLAEKRAKAQELAESIDPKTLDAYTGEYEIEQLGMRLSVSRGEDGLYVEQPGEAPRELLPLSETRFFIIVGIDIYEVEFTLDDAHQVTGLVVTVSDQSYPAKRK